MRACRRQAEIPPPSIPNARFQKLIQATASRRMKYSNRIDLSGSVENRGQRYPKWEHNDGLLRGWRDDYQVILGTTSVQRNLRVSVLWPPRTRRASSRSRARANTPGAMACLHMGSMVVSVAFRRHIRRADARYLGAAVCRVDGGARAYILRTFWAKECLPEGLSAQRKVVCTH